MSNKIRVHQLAKELKISNNELLEIMHQEGVEVSSHLSSIDDDIAEILREQITETQTAALLEEPPNKAKKKTGKKSKPAPEAEEEAKQKPKSKKKNKQPTKNAPAPQPEKKASEGKKTARQKKPSPPPVPLVPKSNGQEIRLKPPIIVRDLAKALGRKPNQIIQDLMKMNIFANINQTIETDIAQKICSERNKTLVIERREHKGGRKNPVAAINPEDIVFKNAEVTERPPVIAFLGHVDHGKTSLQDAIRKTNVTSQESGGITQHIGASTINWEGQLLTFIDTPGHEAFTAMRARGAEVTDIVVLVVAADDGFMPQTIEAVRHAKAAGVQIVVAINKIDLPGANVDRILAQMQENDLFPEDWGGDIGVVRVSAITGEGIDDLLERLVLEAELLELKANPKLPVRAVVLESQIEEGLGGTVNILIKNGSVHYGDIVLCGQVYGKVKALIDVQGNRIKEAGPGMPVKLVGLSGLPECGALLVGCENEKQAKRLTQERKTQSREEQLQTTRNASLEDLFRQIEEEERKILKVIIKSDVQGTAEAIINSLKKLETPKIRVEVLLASAGAVTDNDVLLASASDAIIIGFHVRTNPGVNAIAKKEGVEIRLYSVIYELVDDVRQAMIGMLDPITREKELGQARIIQVFELTKGGNVCGCRVLKGTIQVNAKARVKRGRELIYNGSIVSLRHFQNDVKEIRQGMECGIRLDNFSDFQPDDIIEVYEYIDMPGEL